MPNCSVQCVSVFSVEAIKDKNHINMSDWSWIECGFKRASSSRCSHLGHHEAKTRPSKRSHDIDLDISSGGSLLPYFMISCVSCSPAHCVLLSTDGSDATMSAKRSKTAVRSLLPPPARLQSTTTDPWPLDLSDCPTALPPTLPPSLLAHRAPTPSQRHQSALGRSAASFTTRPSEDEATPPVPEDPHAVHGSPPQPPKATLKKKEEKRKAHSWHVTKPGISRRAATNRRLRLRNQKLYESM